MSRIILTRHDNNDEHIVIGWDRAQMTYYWQEFAREPRITYSEERGKWLVDDRPYDSKVEAQDHQYDGWEEMVGYAGYTMAELPKVSDLIESAMLHNKAVSDAMVDLIEQGSLLPMLREHKQLPSPASNVIVDMSHRDV